ncbi:MAG: hypothetical protein ABIO02_00625 [Patescibacteria group bacterium]
MDEDDYRIKIEIEIAKMLMGQLENREITPERAEVISKFIVDHMLPHMSLNEIYVLTKTFNKEFPELRKIEIEVGEDYEKKLRETVIPIVDKLISEHKEKAAVKLFKKVNEDSLEIN